MNCPKCGSEQVAADANFCQNCGTPTIRVDVDVKENLGRVIGVQTEVIQGNVYGKDIYQVYYSSEYPTLVAGKVIHSVEEMKAHRVILRFRTDGETYENVIEKIKRNEFILPL